MSEICRFFGIIITMYNRDHKPPHFHARYGEFKAEITLDGIILNGTMPPRIIGFIMEWLLKHKKELEDNWNIVQNMKNPNKIEPLE
ncbi:MAG: DUF4160 domain-containing protein [bacterium]